MSWRRLRNLVRAQRWSFKLEEVWASHGIASPGLGIAFNGRIKNDGFRVGTVYVTLEVAGTYDHNSAVFRSDDGDDSARIRARLVDIPPGKTAGFSIPWRVPAGVPAGVYDFRVQVWNPHRLYRQRWPYKFDDSGWLGAFEMLTDPPRPILVEGGAEAASPPTVFISYSWDNVPHTDWVRRLAEELHKNGVRVVLDRWDLQPGEEIYHFMERGARDSDRVIIVSTPGYVEKANARVGGVGVETVVTSSLYAQARETEKRRFIPIVRKFPKTRSSPLPSYLGGALYINMSGDDWRGEPFSLLLRAIFGEYEYRPPPIGPAPAFEQP